MSLVSSRTLGSGNCPVCREPQRACTSPWHDPSRFDNHITIEREGRTMADEPKQLDEYEVEQGNTTATYKLTPEDAKRMGAKKKVGTPPAGKSRTTANKAASPPAAPAATPAKTADTNP